MSISSKAFCHDYPVKKKQATSLILLLMSTHILIVSVLWCKALMNSMVHAYSYLDTGVFT